MASTILTRSLAANAGFSATTGIVLIVAAAPLSRWLGIPAWLTALIGFGLAAFALLVVRVSRSPRRAMVAGVIVADAIWVLAAAVIIVGFPHTMSVSGLWALGMVTVVVADLLLIQAWGLSRQTA